MEKSALTLSNTLYEYLLSVSVKEHPALAQLRKETAKDPMAIMQIPAEQGQFMGLLIKLIGARKTLEIGTYTGYSTLCAALATPADGLTIACDMSEEWTAIGKPFWVQAEIDHKIDLRIADANTTLDHLLDQGHRETFDFAFIDADKTSYDSYYEKTLSLLRPGGLICIDNVFLFGAVADPELLPPSLKGKISPEDIQAIDALNQKIYRDERVDISMLPVADGLTLVRKR